MVSELVLFQLSSFFALVGMTLGWRGVMTKYAGFYDLPTAWNQVFWGILLGGFYAMSADNGLFVPYFKTASDDEVYAGLNIISLILITLVASVGSHLLLRRKRVRRGGSQPASGWALGLAIGGMVAMVVIYRTFEIAGGVTLFSLSNAIMFALVVPRADAIITARHGFMMLHDKRWGAVLRSTFWRAALLVAVYFVVFQPLGWVFILPFILLSNPSADAWIWESVPKEGRRRLRRIWAEEAREREHSGRQVEAGASIARVHESE